MDNSERNVGFEQVQAEEFAKLFKRFAKLRLYSMPALLLTMLLFLLADPSAWRRWLIGLVAVVAIYRVHLEYHRIIVRGFARERIPSVLLVAGPTVACAMFASGGIDSPLLPMLIPLGTFLALFGLPRQVRWFLAIGSTLLWAMTWLSWSGSLPDQIPRLFGGGARVVENPVLLFVRTLLLNLALVWGALLGTLLRGAFQSMIVRALTARDETLQMHRESTQTLTVLAGEIAHELKNPLTSVKGLAALIDRELPPREKERMTVLRREVERMQETLESFLNFSRPLVPLDAAPVEVRALCRSVALLHEGIAAERKVELRVSEAEEVTLLADVRKLKQVLINLVQNALEATPPNGTVELTAKRSATGARIEVLDRGSGLLQEKRERVFEPGVTTKEKGSGLGLTIARALARQHGGEIRLLERAGGGTIAELMLPERPS